MVGIVMTDKKDSKKGTNISSFFSKSFKTKQTKAQELDQSCMLERYSDPQIEKEFKIHATDLLNYIQNTKKSMFEYENLPSEEMVKILRNVAANGTLELTLEQKTIFSTACNSDTNLQNFHLSDCREYMKQVLADAEFSNSISSIPSK